MADMAELRRRLALEKGLKVFRLRLLDAGLKPRAITSLMARLHRRLEDGKVLKRRTWIDLATREVGLELRTSGLAGKAAGALPAFKAAIRREGHAAPHESLSLQDFLQHLLKLKKLGPLRKLLALIPGLARLAREVDEGEIAMAEAILKSMTLDERRHPEIIGAARQRRIAAGAGCSPKDVEALLDQFAMAQRLSEG